MPSNVTVPETLVFTFDVEVLVVVFDPPPPPHPAATPASAVTTAAAAATRAIRFFPPLEPILTLKLLSRSCPRHRCLDLSPRRRSGARGCRLPPRPASPPRPMLVRRSGRPAAPPSPCSRARVLRPGLPRPARAP